MVKEFNFKKSLGQNFLLSEEICEKMVRSLQIKPHDKIIEVGPGQGMLTKYILEECNKTNASLIAVEIDKDLIPVLTDKFGKEKNLTIINSNIINFLDAEFAQKELNANKQIKFIGSLPYGITSPLIHKIVKLSNQPELCVFLIQKEVALKISSPPPKSNYLSVFTQTFYKIKISDYVDKNLFNPKPKVDGAVVIMVKRTPNLEIKDITLYENFLHHAFSRPRKMLNKIFTKSDIEKFNMEPRKRAHDYGWEEFCRAFTTKRARN